MAPRPARSAQPRPSKAAAASTADRTERAERPTRRAVSRTANSASGNDSHSSNDSNSSGNANVPAGRDDKRKQILKAAVKVFAEKGYHGCRISDVADEAGVAYGLVYHYYGNKDGLLAAVFDTNWSVFAKAIRDISEIPNMTMFEKLRQIIEAAFQAFELFPLVVKVLVLEFGRNARLGEALENPAVTEVFGSIARIFEDGKKSGELYDGIDPHAMSVLFMGLLETAFVSFVLTSHGARSKVQSQITTDKMKTTLLSMCQRALLGAIKKSAP